MKVQLPDIPEDQKTPLVLILLRIIQDQGEQIALLKDEVAKLKGQKPRPKLPKSNTANDAKHKPKGSGNASQCARSRKSRRKEQRVIEPANLPGGSIFKGYEDYNVQDLQFESIEIQFRLAVYLGPDGSRIRGELPPEYRQGHFSAELIAYCISQYHQCHVTEPLLLEQLYEMGIDMSAAQLSNILIQNKARFHEEKQEVLKAGVSFSDFLNADDTGARHDGKNGYCTAIGSPLFSYFQSTNSKSRMNFLKVLQGNQELYSMTEEALNYAFDHGIREKTLEILEKNKNKQFLNAEAWEAFLKGRMVLSKTDCKIATEAALLGGAFENGLNPNLITISDGAGQFALFIHGLCWVHEERHYRKLIPVSKTEEFEIEAIRSDIWDFYERLKIYKKSPTVPEQTELSKQFDKIFGRKYESQTLNSLLARTRSRKEGLLLVLKHPFLPLHNNDCERDIREYVKRRKVSGSTRSEEGRQARDTFTSLKKTCKKLRIAFWDYLRDRLTNENKIPRLSDLIEKKSREFGVPQTA
jgi:Transposase IS66 family